MWAKEPVIYSCAVGSRPRHGTIMSEPMNRELRSQESPICEVVWRGVVPYDRGLELMAIRRRQRQANLVGDALYLLEHPHVITTGRRGSLSSLRVSADTLHAMGVALHRTGRGGDLTYHGPGQLVGYPIVDLRSLGLGARGYVAGVEETLIRTASAFGIAAGRRTGYPGVWVGSDKVAAIGVEITRGVTSHGFALNVSTDLRFFGTIVPCGITDGGVTSFEKLLGRPVAVSDVMTRLVEAFGMVFGRRMAWTAVEAPSVG